MIIAEGPDGGGKTTLLEAIARSGTREVHHSGGPPADVEELMHRMADILEKADTHVFDRFPLISEYVYGTITRPIEPRTSYKSLVMRMVSFSARVNPVIVYCRPPLKTLIDYAPLLVAKAHKPESHVENVKQQIVKITDFYDGLIMLLRPIFTILDYDRTQTHRNAGFVQHLLDVERDQCVE